MIKDAKKALSKVKTVLVDGGYTGEKFATNLFQMIGATVTVAKKS